MYCSKETVCAAETHEEEPTRDALNETEEEILSEERNMSSSLGNDFFSTRARKETMGQQPARDEGKGKESKCISEEEEKEEKQGEREDRMEAGERGCPVEGEKEVRNGANALVADEGKSETNPIVNGILFIKAATDDSD